ncbi:MAG: hypothetical protein KGL16_00095 [Acidobacteriota bacterium]|nr:hypothetical protein [Acidobacteriota bacterium]
MHHKRGWAHHMRARALATGVVLAAAAALPSGATAAAPTLYVGHGATGNDSGCAAPGYSSVQAAVDAAPTGATVYLCGGQFAEQVFIAKSLTLTGDAGSGLTAAGTAFAGQSAYPSVFTTDNLAAPQALLVVTGGDVQVEGLTITGGSTNGGCANDEYGILALGGSVEVSHDQVLGVADTNSGLWGCQYGVAIQVGRSYWPTVGFGSFPQVDFAAGATISHSLVAGYQKNGITVDGTGSSALIAHDTVAGGSAGFDPIIGQNGIQISRGATATVTHDTVTGNAYTGMGGASATGVLVYGGGGDPLTAGVVIAHNTLTGNDIGIALANYNADSTGAAASVTGDTAAYNTIADDADTNVSGLVNPAYQVLAGYQAGIEDIGNGDVLAHNAIYGGGYASQGTYDYSTNPNLFTATDTANIFARPIDAGLAFPTTSPTIVDNTYDGQPTS